MFLIPTGIRRRGFSVANSLLFNSSDSAYLSESSAFLSDSQTYTVSCWVKRGNTGGNHPIFGDYSSTGEQCHMGFDSSDKLYLNSRIANAQVTSAVSADPIRDPSAHLHIVFAIDTTQGTAANRLRTYVNNVEYALTGTLPPLNSYHNLDGCEIGAAQGALNYYFDGYISQFVFIQGAQLTPSSFGEAHPDSPDLWRPKDLSGLSFANSESFYLDFADGTSTTTLGYDVSGNANHWTLNGMATTDQVLDTPTDNFATLNSLDVGSGTLTNGNTTVSSTTDRIGTIGVSTGKWAWEVTVNTGGDFGIVENNLTGTESVAADVAAEVVEFELDCDSGTLKKRVDGGSLENVDLALTSGATYFPLVKAACSVDFGQFGFTPTDGTFKTLTSNHLPIPTIKDPGDYFDIPHYTGNASTRTIATSNKVDWVLIKNRDALDAWNLVDAVRGATLELNPNVTLHESTDSNGVTSFGGTTGFNLGTGANGYNDNTENFFAWCLTESAIAGFDIVSYTGNGTNRTISHNLGVIPELMIVKERNTTSEQGWYIYNPTSGSGQRLLWESNVADGASTVWNSTAPTSAVFSLDSSSAVNEDTKNYIAYLFTTVPGYSKVFTYAGNNSSNGTFVPCDFKPALVMIKSIDGGSWIVMDYKRQTSTDRWNYMLRPDLNNGSLAQVGIEALSNGFKPYTTYADINAVETFIGIAFARYPFALLNTRR